MSAILDERSGAGWRMLRADSLLVLRDLPAESVDAVITDPPYSSGGQFRGDRAGLSSEKYGRADGSIVTMAEVEGDNRDQRAYLAWCSLWLAECLRIAKPGAFGALFSDWRQLATTTDAIQCGGFLMRGIAPWCKTAERPAPRRPSRSAEFVVWGSKGPMAPDRDSEPEKRGHWVEDQPEPSHWIAGLPQMKGREHMTEKPITVMRDLARHCVRGGVILDPFAGSGSTGCAALLEGRRFIGIETSPAYFDIACRRLAETEAQADRGSFKNGQTAMFGGAA